MAHPGLCAQRDGVLVSVASNLAVCLLNVVVREKLHGQFVHLRTGAGAWSTSAWVVICHTRGSGPRLLMLAPCRLLGTEVRLAINVVDGVFEFTMAVSFFGNTLRRAPTLDGLEV